MSIDRDSVATALGVPCSVEGCDRKSYAKGFCFRHYQHNRIHGDPVKPKEGTRPVGAPKKYTTVTQCSVDGCLSLPISRGLCVRHYQNQRYHELRKSSSAFASVPESKVESHEPGSGTEAEPKPEA